MKLNVIVEGEGGTIEETVDADLESFNEFFRTFNTDPISRPERAILKTYLAYKLGLMKK